MKRNVTFDTKFKPGDKVWYLKTSEDNRETTVYSSIVENIEALLFIDKEGRTVKILYGISDRISGAEEKLLFSTEKEAVEQLKDVKYYKKLLARDEKEDKEE
jgi:hypothetical protein